MNKTLRKLLGNTLARMYNNATGMIIVYNEKQNEWIIKSNRGTKKRIKYNEAGKQTLLIDLNYLS